MLKLRPFKVARAPPPWGKARISVSRFPGKARPSHASMALGRNHAPQILVQCPICGKRRVLRAEWAEEFLAHPAFPCIFTEACYGFLCRRHDFCVGQVHHTSSTVRSR